MTPSQRVHTTLLVAAVGTMLPVGAAQALEILGNKFVDPMSGSGTNADSRMYDQIYILGNRIPTAPRGAQGPVRTETMPGQSASEKREYNEKLYILGNTFWLPGKEK